MKNPDYMTTQQYETHIAYRDIVEAAGLYSKQQPTTLWFFLAGRIMDDPVVATAMLKIDQQQAQRVAESTEDTVEACRKVYGGDPYGPLKQFLRAMSKEERAALKRRLTARNSR